MSYWFTNLWRAMKGLWIYYVFYVGFAVMSSLLPGYGRLCNAFHLLDFIFYVLIIVIMLNIIFGIIIDTFSDLRGRKEEKESDKRSTCLICGLGRQVFEDHNVDFRDHEEDCHNRDDYVYFYCQTMDKDAGERSGYERYVYLQINSQEVAWFPNGKSLDIDQKDEEKEDPSALKMDALSVQVKQCLRYLADLKTQNKRRRDLQIDDAAGADNARKLPSSGKGPPPPKLKKRPLPGDGNRGGQRKLLAPKRLGAP